MIPKNVNRAIALGPRLKNCGGSLGKELTLPIMLRSYWRKRHRSQRSLGQVVGTASACLGARLSPW